MPKLQQRPHFAAQQIRKLREESHDLHIFLAHFQLCRVQYTDGESPLSGAWDSQGLQPSSTPPPSTPHCGTTRLQRSLGSTLLPVGAPTLLLGAHMRQRHFKFCSGFNTGQPRGDYVSLLNAQNNTLQPLTSGLFLLALRQRCCNVITS